jgi:hypothetical protein
MSLIANPVKPPGAPRTQIEAWIDVLDRAEPDQSGWRDAFDGLKLELTKARKIRRLGQIPAGLAFLVLIALYVVHHIGRDAWTAPQGWLNNGTVLVWTVVLIWEFVVRRVFPVLELESRVAALLRYYGATGVSQGDEDLQ